MVKIVRRLKLFFKRLDARASKRLRSFYMTLTPKRLQLLLSFLDFIEKTSFFMALLLLAYILSPNPYDSQTFDKLGKFILFIYIAYCESNRKNGKGKF